VSELLYLADNTRDLWLGRRPLVDLGTNLEHTGDGAGDHAFQGFSPQLILPAMQFPAP